MPEFSENALGYSCKKANIPGRFVDLLRFIDKTERHGATQTAERAHYNADMAIGGRSVEHRAVPAGQLWNGSSDRPDGAARGLPGPVGSGGMLSPGGRSRRPGGPHPPAPGMGADGMRRAVRRRHGRRSG